MAKKEKQEVVVEETTQVEVEAPAPTPVKVKPVVVKKPDWEIKDRQYYLIGDKEPLTFTIPARHSRRHPLLWFDTETKTQREIRYATNQNSCFVDEQKGEVTLGHITFRDGVLAVPKAQQALQKLLSLYHPMLGRKYDERKPVEVAMTDLQHLELELDALTAARNMDVEQREAILRVEIGSKVNSLSSSEIRRDVMRLAKMNPALFLALAADENVMLRNFAITATEQGIIKISQDNKSVLWSSNDRKLMTIPFDENAYTALASWFKTDEGLEVYRSIEKRLK
jgi:hypothetical protein